MTRSHSPAFNPLPVGRHIRRLREQSGTTQVRLALYCGVTQRCIGQIEQGLRLPSSPVLYMLARWFGVSMESLLEGR